MSIHIKLAPLLRKSSDGHKIIEVTGANILECIHGLELQFPTVRRWLYDKQGELWSGVIIFLNRERIFNDELTGPLNDGDEILIMLAIAGG